MIQLTDNAAAQINRLKQQQDADVFLRLSVNGGGCSGFQYTFTLGTIKTADDIIFEHNDAQVVVDNVSLSLLEGALIDYEEDMASSKFVIKNPNAASSCGCGNSFSI
jgi:iron-sulfur cluster insertion protein